MVLLSAACGKDSGKSDSPPAAKSSATDTKTSSGVAGDTRTKPRNVAPFKAEYGPRFLAFMNELSPVVVANKGKCDAMAAAAEPIITKHADTITLMRDSNSPAARTWRASQKVAVAGFQAAMKHMLACAKNTKVKALFVRMRGAKR